MPFDEWNEELEVLESILGKETIHHDAENNQLTVQCCINIKSNTIKVSNSIELEDNTESNKEVFEQILSYLPPVLLTCKPSDGYPMHDNLALISVNCVWLSKDELSSVENHLKAMWMEGDPVVYNLITWIQDEILEYLDIFDEIHISDTENEYSSDILTRITIIDKYNRENTIKMFNTHDHECCTCFCEFLGEEMCLVGCLHSYCSDCITTLITVQYENGRYCAINCSVCDTFVGREVIKKFLDSDKFEIWEERFVMQSVEENPMILFCPRCKNYAVREEDNLGNCPSCTFQFCELCKESWHPGNCESFGEYETRYANQSKKAKAETQQSRLEKKHKKQEMLTQMMMKAFMVQCPKCKCWVMRDQGCNHMFCSLCKTNFCYVCGQTPEKHKAGGLCGSYIPQAPTDIKTLDDTQRVFFDRLKVTAKFRPTVENLIATDDGNEITRCVSCRSKIQRQKGNNHGKCAVCKAQFCFLCRALIKGTSHFVASGCQQHGGTVKH